MTERAHVLRQFSLQWPPLTAALLSRALRWVMLMVVGGLIWLGSLLLRHRAARPENPGTTAAADEGH